MPRDTTARAEMIDIGLRMLRELPTARVFRFLTAREVSKRAGRTTGAFYHWFPSQFDYYDALLERIFSVEVAADLTPTEEEIECIISSRGGLRRVVDTLADHHRLVREKPLLRLLLFFATRRGAEAQIDAALVRHYRDFDVAYGAVVDLHLAGRGRRVAPPYNGRTVARMVNALADGLALREPSTDDDALAYGLCVAAITEAMSVEIDSDDDFDAVVDRLDRRYPTVGGGSHHSF